MDVHTPNINAAHIRTQDLTTLVPGRPATTIKKIPKILEDLTDADGILLQDADGEQLQTKERI